MRIQLILTALGTALVSASASAQKTTYDYDKGADFSRLKTYAWTTGHTLQDELNHKRVVGAIDEQLAAKGLTRVEVGANPDALVAYHASFDRNLQINATSTEPLGLRFGGTRNGSARVSEIVLGTLVVDMVDANTRSILWRGIATREIDATAKPEQRDKNAGKAAKKPFEHYPPQ